MDDVSTIGTLTLEYLARGFTVPRACMVRDANGKALAVITEFSEGEITRVLAGEYRSLVAQSQVEKETGDA